MYEMIKFHTNNDKPVTISLQFQIKAPD